MHSLTFFLVVFEDITNDRFVQLMLQRQSTRLHASTEKKAGYLKWIFTKVSLQQTVTKIHSSVSSTKNLQIGFFQLSEGYLVCSASLYIYKKSPNFQQ